MNKHLKNNMQRFILKSLLSRCAFTLSEVLITLGVIGVVAAITMPSVVKHYKLKVMCEQLKKSYTTLQNGIRMAEADHGPMVEWPDSGDMDMLEYYETYFKPYYNGIELCEYCHNCGYEKDIMDGGNFNRRKWTGGDDIRLRSNSSRVLFKLPDGSVVFIFRGDSVWYTKKFYIDINGPKNPNKLGSDVFIFSRGSVKGIVPYSGNCNATSRYGCAQYIIENGWKVPDSYPY